MTTSIQDVKDISNIVGKLAIKGVENIDKATAPLRRESNNINTKPLTVSGTIEATNNERTKIGLLPLEENEALDRAAEVRASDMFKRQYFAHESPTGEGAQEAAQGEGYAFLSIGENLALGNFDGDKDLVKAWMDSPGHKANILRSGYKEIGVAVQKGIFEGKAAWIGVQVFGTPESICPSPNKTTSDLISTNELQLEILRMSLDAQRAELRSQGRYSQNYNEKVKVYNAAVESYNDLLGKTKNLIEVYNKEVSTFNACVSAIK